MSLVGKSDDGTLACFGWNSPPLSGQGRWSFAVQNDFVADPYGNEVSDAFLENRGGFLLRSR